jgi:hypothetical protein
MKISDTTSINTFFQLYKSLNYNKSNYKGGLIGSKKASSRRYINNIFRLNDIVVAFVDKNNNPGSNSFSYYETEEWLKKYIPEK